MEVREAALIGVAFLQNGGFTMNKEDLDFLREMITVLHGGVARLEFGDTNDGLSAIHEGLDGLDELLEDLEEYDG